MRRLRESRPFATVVLAALLGPLLVALPAARAAETRLGRAVVPTFEAVRLALDADKLDYSGSARIDLEVREETNTIQFHARGLTLGRMSLVPGAGGDAPSGDGASGTARRFTAEIPLTHEIGDGGVVTVRTSERLAPGPYVLSIDFTNPFDTQAASLYRLETGGRAYAFTQFESNDAREAFPCWDEPSFKIPYQITIEVPEAHEAVSNTPPQSTTVAGGVKTVAFKKTPPLPSYLLAIATGPLEFVPIPGLSVPGRVVTVRGGSRLAGEAVRTTPPILAALERYFGRPYPFEKLDLIAVPEYWYGAMENPGAIVYSESRLLLDPDAMNISDRRSLISTTAHELAHIWFGDLVTMAWWDDLWLNESFASWMGNKITDEVYPEFQSQLRSVESAERAKRTDARPSTHAMRQPVEAADNLQQIADELAYSKGQAVLAMFERWLGPETFRLGVLDYLETHAWGNATGSDLWNALTKAARESRGPAAGRDVAAAMATFLDQAGVPLVTATRAGGNRVSLRQSRFWSTGAASAESPSAAGAMGAAAATGDAAAGAPASRWQIPVALKFSDGRTTRTQHVLLTEEEQIVTLECEGSPAWIHPNADEAGYYRWSVEPSILDALATRAAESLDGRERVGFLGNLAALLNAGTIRGDDMLRFIAGFAHDPEPEVISSLLEALDQIDDSLIADDARGAYAAYVRKILRPAADRFGLSRRPGEDEAVTSRRPKLIAYLADEGRDGVIIAYAESLAASYLADPMSIDPSFAGTALNLAAIRGDRSLFETYRTRFEAARIPTERQLFLSALGRFREPAVADEALRYVLAGPLRPQELRVIPMAMAGAPEMQDRAFLWMTENFDGIAARIPAPFLVFLPYFARGCSAERLSAARAFFSDPAHSPTGTEQELAKVADSVNECVRLREREGPAATRYLRERAAAEAGGGGASGARGAR